jgi:antitoxin YefM
MDAITYSYARENLASMMNRVCEDNTPIIITRQKAKAVVVMSLEDYNSIEETAYLLRSQANAEKLRASISNAKAGNLQTHALIEE